MNSPRRPERVSVFGRGRICAIAACDTILSAYNPVSCCALHAKTEVPASSQEGQQARPLGARACGNPRCGQWFEALTRRRQYCSDRCRVMALLERKRRARHGDAA
jgi:hypothetical protein